MWKWANRLWCVALSHQSKRLKHIKSKCSGIFFSRACFPFTLKDRAVWCSQTEFTDAAHARLCSFNVCFQCQTHRPNLKRSRATFFSSQVNESNAGTVIFIHCRSHGSMKAALVFWARYHCSLDLLTFLAAHQSDLYFWTR